MLENKALTVSPGTMRTYLMDGLKSVHYKRLKNNCKTYNIVYDNATNEFHWTCWLSQAIGKDLKYYYIFANWFGRRYGLQLIGGKRKRDDTVITFKYVYVRPKEKN